MSEQDYEGLIREFRDHLNRCITQTVISGVDINVLVALCCRVADALTVLLSARDTALRDLEQHERMAHAYPKLSAFFTKHALGPKLKPSCLVCGRDDYEHPAIQHAELPGIVVCHPCRDARTEIARLTRERDALRSALTHP